MKITLRDKRQLTLPPAVCAKLGIAPGDRLELQVEDDALIIRPTRIVALEALDELRRAIAESSVTEAELLESGRKTRQSLFDERYSNPAKKHGA